MAIFKRHNFGKDKVIGWWEITESVESLEEGFIFSVENIQDYHTLSHPSKKSEWLVIRLLLRSLLADWNEDYEGVYKDEFGKPHLSNRDYHISVTHAAEYVVVVIDKKKPVGIDLEKIRPKILKIAYKFLSEQELKDSGNELNKLTVYWSAKESLYKLYGRKKLIFSTDLYVKHFEMKNFGMCFGVIYSDNKEFHHEIHFIKENDFILTYTV